MTYDPLNKKCLVLSRKIIIKFKQLESTTLRPRWPDLQKKNPVKISRFHIKKILHLIKIISKIKTILNLIHLEALFYVN